MLVAEDASPELFKNLAKKMSVDKRTLVAMIYELNHFSAKECGLVLNVKEDTLYYQFENFSLDRLNQLVLRNNLLFRLCDSFLKKDFKNLQDFAIKNFTSRSSMYRRIEQLKAILKEYRIVLDLSNDFFLLLRRSRLDIFSLNYI